MLLDGAEHPRPGPGSQSAARARRHGVPEADAVSDVDLREHRVRRPPLRAHLARRPRPAGRIGAAPRRDLGRGQGQAACQRAQPVGRPAAAPVHRPHRRGQAGGDPARRALLGARPDLHRQDRGADRRAQGRLHDRDRHPQHAAGGPRAPTSPPSCISASWSSSTPRARCSPRPRTGAPRTTSPAASADARERRDEDGNDRTHPQGVRRRSAGARADGRRDGRSRRAPDRRRDRCAQQARHGAGAERHRRRQQDRRAAARDRGEGDPHHRAAPADGGRPARHRRRAARLQRPRADRRPRQEHRQARRWCSTPSSTCRR